MCPNAAFPPPLSAVCDGHFSTRRLDRRGGKRLHMMSLSAPLEVPTDQPLLDYVSFLQAIMYVMRSQAEVVKAFRLSCFNVLVKNFDDHAGDDVSRLPITEGY